METTITAEGENSKALTEEVKRLESARQLEKDWREACERELAGVRREAEDLALNKKDLETRLEASSAEAGMMKSRAEDLERRLNEATEAGSAASVANAELKDKLCNLTGGLTELVRELNNAIDFASVMRHRICASLRQSAADSRPASLADKSAACEQAKITQLQEMIDLQKLLLASS
jgi:chromosome segregation ATPase